MPQIKYIRELNASMVQDLKENGYPDTIQNRLRWLLTVAYVNESRSPENQLLPEITEAIHAEIEAIYDFMALPQRV